MNIVPIEKNLKEEHKNVISIFHDTLEYYKKFVGEVLNSPKYDDEYKVDLLLSSGIGKIINISKKYSEELGTSIFEEKKITILDVIDGIDELESDARYSAEISLDQIVELKISLDKLKKFMYENFILEINILNG